MPRISIAGSRPGSRAATQQTSARPGVVLPDRSRRRCHARRHGGDPRLRHQCGALRDHARNVLDLTVVMADGDDITTARRARKSSAGYDSPGCSSARKERSALSPRWGSALRDPERSRAASARSLDRGRLQHRHPDDPARHPGRPIELVDDSPSPGLQRLFASSISPRCRPCSSNFTAPPAGSRAGRRSARSPAKSAAALSRGPPARRTHRLWQARHDAFGAVRCAPARRFSRPTSACRSPAWQNASSRPRRTSDAAAFRAR